MLLRSRLVIFFFFNDTATTEIYTLSLHDALPIWQNCVTVFSFSKNHFSSPSGRWSIDHRPEGRSEERFSRNAETDLVCRLLLEKKKETRSPCTDIFPIPPGGHASETEAHLPSARL